MLAKMQKNWISHTFLVGIQKGIVTSENSLVIIYKTKHILTNYILGHSSWRIENLCPCKYLYVMSIADFLVITKTLKTTQMIFYD